MTFTIEKKPKTKKVGIRITDTVEKQALKFGKKQGVDKLGTICGELVVYALKTIKGSK